MAKLNLNYDHLPESAKLKRFAEAFALQQGVPLEDLFLPTLRAIAQQMGHDANDDEADQNAALAVAERRGAKAKKGRDDRAA